MKHPKTITAFLLLITSFTCYGQTPTDRWDETPAIEVVGKAEKKIVPDEIYIAINILERENGRDKITIEAQEAELKVALQSIDVPLENLSLSDANANYVPLKWSKKDVVTKKEYVLKVGDALMVGKVFEKLDELKITSAYISRVSHSKIEEFKKEVRILAIQAAKEKADYLLNAIGQETGKAIEVNEQIINGRLDDSTLNVIRNRNNLYEEELKMSSTEPYQIIQFEKIILQSAIYVKFEIK